jgi:hypothetical protein
MGMSTPTAFTVRPAPMPELSFGVATPGDTKELRGDDVASAANPLHYIPFVSQVYEAVSGDGGSAAMKIIGGAALGGPLGLVAGLAGAIFEQVAGESVGTAVAGLFSGDDAAVQTAQAKTADAAYSVAQADLAPPAQEVLPPETPAAMVAAAAATPNLSPASAITDIGDAESREDAAVLALFGGQSPSAHRSYQKAQMLSYLQDVNHSLVM